MGPSITIRMKNQPVIRTEKKTGLKPVDFENRKPLCKRFRKLKTGLQPVSKNENRYETSFEI